jgi:outer membrane protein
VTSHATEEAQKNLEINREKLQALKGALLKDLHDSFLSTNSSVQRIAAAQKALQSSTKARQAMEKSFQYSMQTISDVLLSQAREMKAKRDLLQAKYAYIINRSRFERVTGQISEYYLELVNQWLQPL